MDKNISRMRREVGEVIAAQLAETVYQRLPTIRVHCIFIRFKFILPAQRIAKQPKDPRKRRIEDTKSQHVQMQGSDLSAHCPAHLAVVDHQGEQIEHQAGSGNAQYSTEDNVFLFVMTHS